MENITLNRASIPQQKAKGILPESSNTNFQSTIKTANDQPMSQMAILSSLEQMIKGLIKGLSEDKGKPSGQGTDNKAKEGSARKEGEAVINGGDIAIQAGNGTDGAIGQPADGGAIEPVFTWQVGTNSDDTLNGRSKTTDYIWGGDGDDKIDGKSGNDWLFGGNGDDQIDGGSGHDWLFGGTGDDILNGGSGNDRLYGGWGDDVLKGGSGNDYLNGGRGDDVLKGGSGRDWLYGGAGDDILKGGSGNDRLYGDQGNDKLDGGSGRDWLYGGTGDDEIKGGAGNDYLIGGTGDDEIKGGAGNDYLNGGAGNDTIDAKQGRNRVYGGTGNDTISSGLSSSSSGGLNNRIDGGKDTDTVNYSGDSTDYEIFPKTTSPQYMVRNKATGAFDIVRNVEHLKFADGVTVDLPF